MFSYIDNKNDTTAQTNNETTVHTEISAAITQNSTILNPVVWLIEIGLAILLQGHLSPHMTQVMQLAFIALAFLFQSEGLAILSSRGV